MIPRTPSPCFEDLYELDHVIRLLQEDVSAIESCPGYDSLPNGVIKPLLNAIEAQKRGQRDENDKLYPGAFDRSYLVEEYQGAAAILENALWNPKTLPVNLNDLTIRLYRLMIVGNMSGEQLRTALSDLADAKKDADHGKKFKGKAPGAVGPIRKAIGRVLKKNPKMKTLEIWEEIKKKPPKGWAVMENRQGKYIEGPANKEMNYRRFENAVCEERKVFKQQ